MNNVHFLLYCPFPLCQEDFIKGSYFCGHPFKPCSRMPFWYSSALGMKRFRPHLAPMPAYTQTEQTTSRTGWKLWLSQGKMNRDTVRGVTFLLLWARKSPAFKRKILKARPLLYVVLFYFLRNSKNWKANFHYSSSILESCFLVVTGTASQFSGVYFPLRPLCVFDYNENCCQNDVTASSRPLRVKRLDFLDGQTHRISDFLIGQLST